MSAYEIVDASFVESKLGKMPIVDVRSIGAYAADHIPGAVNITLDYAELSDDVATALVEDFQDHDIYADTEAIVYCQGGMHSKEVCDLLSAQGYSKLYCYAGGMTDWMLNPAREVVAA